MTKAIEKWIETNKAKFKNKKDQSHLVDFLKDQFPLKNSINFSYEECVKKADVWVSGLHEKAREINSRGSFKPVMSFADGYSIVQLQDRAATAWEGLKMGHCVGSEGYNPKKIFSLRDPKGLPHATMYIEKKIVEEIEGKENKEVISKYQPYLVDFIIQSKILCDDLGFIRTGSYELKSLENYFTGIKFGKSHRNIILHVPSLKAKEGVDFLSIIKKDSLHKEISYYIDGHTAPEFFESLTKEQIKLIKKHNKDGFDRVGISSDGYKELFKRNPVKARELFLTFGLRSHSGKELEECFLHQDEEFVALITTLLQYEKEIVYKIVKKVLSKIKIGHHIPYLSHFNDPTLNEMVIRKALSLKKGKLARTRIIMEAFDYEITPSILTQIFKLMPDFDLVSFSKQAGLWDEENESLLKLVLANDLTGKDKKRLMKDLLCSASEDILVSSKTLLLITENEKLSQSQLSRLLTLSELMIRDEEFIKEMNVRLSGLKDKEGEQEVIEKIIKSFYWIPTDRKELKGCQLLK